MTGLAGKITVNAAVDPSQGGNPQLLGNGINFNYNTANDASYDTQLQQYLTNLSADQTFSAAGGIGTSNTLSGYAAASVSWLDAQQQNVASESSYQSTLLSTSTTALSNATGVNLDDEMSQMLDLENSYSASAKLLTTINNMFSDLVNAINQYRDRMSSYISSFSMSSVLLQSILTAQTNLAQAEQEVSTGTYADVGLTLGDEAGQDVSLRGQQSLLQTITTTNNLALDEPRFDPERLDRVADDGAEFSPVLAGVSGGDGNDEAAAASCSRRRKALCSR